jgi:hypothetical protein
MKIQKIMNCFSLIRGTFSTIGAIPLLLLVFSFVLLLNGCNSSEGQSAQPGGKAMNVTFDLLSGYDFEKEQIPELVKSLDGQRVAITGFMLPVDFNDGKVKSFLLLQNQMACCFGMTPKENEFVYVEMGKGGSTKYMPDWPLTVVGKLEVGKKLLVNSIYRMEADNVLVTDGF